MTGLPLTSVSKWAPHPKAAPFTERSADDAFETAANGTATCAGGWQFEYAGVQAGKTYALSVEADHSEGIEVRDALLRAAHWTALKPDRSESGAAPWDYLLPEAVGPGRLRFARVVRAPAGSATLTLRCTFRWVWEGRAVWRTPSVGLKEGASGPARPVRAAVVTGHVRARPAPMPDAQANVAFYGGLCEAAAEAVRPDLIVLPEVALQWGVRGHAVDLAVPAPGPETEAFSRIAKAHRTRIVLGLFERDGDAVYNSAILIGPDGRVDGRYRKVHLAVGGEAESGILPGNAFPVFETEIGRVGCNICMDSSAAESSRAVGLGGADFLALPIMGDHRADRWPPGAPIYNESRWLAIMRTRAMDNQLCMVIARNTVQGSCVIDRKGDVIAWNEGDDDFIHAEVCAEDGYRTWNGACFRDVNWLQRRPHLYGVFSEPENVGSLR